MRADLDGLVALVTGGGGRLGAAMSMALAERGAAVVVADLDGTRAERKAQAIVDEGLTASAVQVDVGEEESVAAAFAATTRRFGGLDVLVNNAAPTLPRRRRRTRRDARPRHVGRDDARNLARLLALRAACGAADGGAGRGIDHQHRLHTRARRRPRADRLPGGEGRTARSTRAIATQCGSRGIRCNTVTLGTFPVSTAPEEWRTRKVAHQLVPREGLPADAANAVVFLASPDSSFITGADLAVDGGMLVHLSSSTDPLTRLARLRAGGG